MYWLKTEFYPYCLRKGIQLLRDDIRFIERCLDRLPQPTHRKIMREYVTIWLDVLAECEKESEGQNIGRRDANTFLLEQLADNP